jgi:HAE1 family hydrophobic/amphiphilic exporter-1
VSRQTIGWTVTGGMIAATFLAIFAVPVLFLNITKLAYGKKKLAEMEANYKPEEHGHQGHGSQGESTPAAGPSEANVNDKETEERKRKDETPPELGT